MAYSHCWTRTRTRIRTPFPMGTLYYAEVFTLVWIWIWIPTQMVSQMVTVPILGADLHPKDRSLSQFYYISIRGSESESEPMGKCCIVQGSVSELSPSPSPAVEISHYTDKTTLTKSNSRREFLAANLTSMRCTPMGFQLQLWAKVSETRLTLRLFGDVTSARIIIRVHQLFVIHVSYSNNNLRQ